ncbi:MAG: aminotransferase class I/II-fold pyridoxal phosphate-dependent enzyme [Deltaproteobacteria bacterium]|nr:MAG: aminotransferase class I/II-fold pyridoxal phosphate-dependent enzyme [Deltaproteobacteria bacterium]
MRTPHLTAKLQGFGTTIFSEMTALAVAHDAVNLGQGAPDFDGPDWIKQAAAEAMVRGANQYCRSFGIPDLCAAIAQHQRRFYDWGVDPETEVTVTAGATEAIFATLLALLDVGDEIVFFEPYYDSYMAAAAAAGARPRTVPLEGPKAPLDVEALRRAITPKTRALLLNTPHNPLGKVFSRDELAAVAEVCREYDLVAITDEVYEHLTFGPPHVPLATLPGMAERTITISSAGKTFSLTGWKIGWAIAPPALSRAVRTAHQFITFCNGTPLQHGIAKALAADDDYFAAFVAGYRKRRDVLCGALADLDMDVLEPDGTYFVCADIRPLGFDDGYAFCRRLPAEVGVAAIPCAAFYEHPERGRHLVRFGFCKRDATLDEGIARLRENLPKMKP